MISLEETRERLYAELQLTLDRLHEAEHRLQEDAGSKRKLEDRLRDLEHMKFVRDRQDQIVESTEAVKSEYGSSKPYVASRARTIGGERRSN